MIFSIYLLFLSIVLVKSFTPSCKTCKFFIPNVINDSLGQCTIFQDKVYDNKNQVTLQKNLAVHCRNDENLCGKSGYLYEPIEKDEYTKTYKNYEYIKSLCSDEIVEETNLEELEKIEKELVVVFQKMRRHNLKVIYNTPNSISKLFRKLKE
jgi:hypothetical protein